MLFDIQYVSASLTDFIRARKRRLLESTQKAFFASSSHSQHIPCSSNRVGISKDLLTLSRSTPFTQNPHSQQPQISHPLTRSLPKRKRPNLSGDQLLKTVSHELIPSPRQDDDCVSQHEQDLQESLNPSARIRFFDNDEEKTDFVYAQHVGQNQDSHNVLHQLTFPSQSFVNQATPKTHNGSTAHLSQNISSGSKFRLLNTQIVSPVASSPHLPVDLKLTPFEQRHEVISEKSVTEVGISCEILTMDDYNLSRANNNKLKEANVYLNQYCAKLKEENRYLTETNLMMIEDFNSVENNILLDLEKLKQDKTD
ncbi:hypothetical protein P9112_004689 [Eukaryota sp. TZLM1-RC]